MTISGNKTFRKIKEKWKKESGLGYVESLVAIAISGILMVAVAALASSVARTTVKNELQDEATQETIMYMDIIKAIKDNGWSTSNGQFPRYSSYEICYDETSGIFSLCDPNTPDIKIFKITDDTFERSIQVEINKDLALFKIILTCKTGKCQNINYTQTFAVNLVDDTLSSLSNAGEGTSEGGSSSPTKGSVIVSNENCGNGVVDKGETCDYGGQLTEVCPIESCVWRCPYNGSYSPSGDVCNYYLVQSSYTAVYGTPASKYRVSSTNSVSQVQSNLASLKVLVDRYK